MATTRMHTPLSCAVTTPHMPEAVIVRSDDALPDTLAGIGLAELITSLLLREGPGPSAVIAADGPVPVGLISWLAMRGVSRISTIALCLQRILPENAESKPVDPAVQTAVSPGFSVSSAWADHNIRVVVSRVKTDDRDRYSLCGAALTSCIGLGDLDECLRRFPPHCALVADPVHDVPLVVSDHPLLADWVGATLMGRNPHSAPASSDWYGSGLMPRTYRVQGDRTVISSWARPPSLKQALPRGVYGPSADVWSGPVPTALADAWGSCVKAACEPFMPLPVTPASVAHADPSAETRDIFMAKLALAVTPETLGELVEALLKGLGLLAAIHPVLKEDISGLQATYCLATRDKGMNVYARFHNGALTASRAPGGPVQVTLIFRDSAALLKLASSPKPDLLNAMLQQQVSFEGNLNYLLKLAYLLRRVLLIVKGEIRGAS